MLLHRLLARNLSLLIPLATKVRRGILTSLCFEALSRPLLRLSHVCRKQKKSETNGTKTLQQRVNKNSPVPDGISDSGIWPWTIQRTTKVRDYLGKFSNIK